MQNLRRFLQRFWVFGAVPNLFQHGLQQGTVKAQSRGGCGCYIYACTKCATEALETTQHPVRIRPKLFTSPCAFPAIDVKNMTHALTHCPDFAADPLD